MARFFRPVFSIFDLFMGLALHFIWAVSHMTVFNAVMWSLAVVLFDVIATEYYRHMDKHRSHQEDTHD